MTTITFKRLKAIGFKPELLSHPGHRYITMTLPCHSFDIVFSFLSIPGNTFRKELIIEGNGGRDFPGEICISHITTIEEIKQLYQLLTKKQL